MTKGEFWLQFGLTLMIVHKLIEKNQKKPNFTQGFKKQYETIKKTFFFTTGLSLDGQRHLNHSGPVIKNNLTATSEYISFRIYLYIVSSICIE